MRDRALGIVVNAKKEKMAKYVQIEQVSLSAAEFRDATASLSRFQAKARRAARMVLVEGRSRGEAARALELSRQAVSVACARVTAAHLARRDPEHYAEEWYAALRISVPYALKQKIIHAIQKIAREAE